MNRALVALGSVLALLGVVVLAITLLRSPASAPPSPSVSGGTQAVDPPSRGWAIGAGGLLAVGAAMVGLGMNRWNRSAA